MNSHPKTSHSISFWDDFINLLLTMNLIQFPAWVSFPANIWIDSSMEEGCLRKIKNLNISDHSNEVVVVTRI
jgi:hypothetical protein